MDANTRVAELQRTFVAPPGLKESRPRDVQLTDAGVALAIVMALLFAGAIVAFIGLSDVVRRQADDRRALIEGGVTVTGEVTRLWTSGDDRRRVNYRFVADGRVYDDHMKVSNERRRALAVGSEVAVRYVPNDPSINALEGTALSSVPTVLPFVIAGAIASGGLLCLLGIRRQRRLLAEGRVAPALVTAHHSHSSSHGGKHRSMTYEFALLSGAMASGKSATSAKPPAIGSVICVIYDAEAPKRNAVYPLSLVMPVK